MQIREFLHHQIDGLDVDQLLIAQDLLAGLAAGKTKEVSSKLTPPPYLKVRESLSALSGSLADDIIRNRDDRI